MSAVEKNELSVSQDRSVALPEWAKKYQYDMGEINRAAKPPFIKCIQSQTREPYKPPFAEGDVVVAPNLKKIGDKENPFVFVPILYFKTYCIHNPFGMIGKLPLVREISYDAESIIAKKCKKFHKTDPCPESPQHMLNYAETHNFFFILEDDDELFDTPIWYPASVGEFKTGQKLVGLLQSRLPYLPFLCRFRGFSEIHKGSQGQWSGLGFLNDATPYVSKQKADRYQQLHETFDKAIRDKQFDLTGGDTEQIGDASSETKF